MRLPITIGLLLFIQLGFSQIQQTARFELEKENSDDYFTVLPAGKDGAIVVRDTEDFSREDGDVWEIVSLDTDLKERWAHEVSIDQKYIIRGYDLVSAHLYLLFREGEYTKSNYLLIRIGVLDGEIERYHIANEVELELSHISVLNDKLIVGGYVRLSPTLFSYTLGDDKFVVVPGFFKDRSDIVDLRTNTNDTFNAVTLEKDYTGYFLRLRTYSDQLDMLFERDIRFEEDRRVLSAKSTGFVNGNIAIVGSYGTQNSTYAQGIYFVTVKPEGQKNAYKYHSFADFGHFFDYMSPSRAKRLKQKAEKKVEGGKSFKYSTRVLVNDVKWQDEDYIITAEVYNPQFDYVNRNSAFNNGFYGNPYGVFNGPGIRSNSRYVQRTSRLSGIDDANGFKYNESIVLALDSRGRLEWDNSITIEDMEMLSLEQVVDVSGSSGKYSMAYLAEDKIRYQTIQYDSVLSDGEADIKLLNDSDEIKHTYEGMGKVMKWFDDVFLVWGYHRVHNNSEPNPKRNVLFVNKLIFE